MVVESDALSQLRRGVVSYCVLATLRRGDTYGFDLVRTLSASGVIASEGTVYPLLARLRREGLVATTWRESDSGPPRRYYRLTDDGEAALSGFVTRWRGFRDSIDEILSTGEEER